MTDEHEPDRWREIREIQKKHIDFYKLLGAIVVICVGVLLFRSLNHSQSESFDVNLTTEIISIAVTVLIVNWFAERRAEQRYKQQLIDDAASISNVVAKNAIHQIRRKGWLEGDSGILRRANLRGAQLTATDLTGANLRQVDLRDANLVRVNLVRANLSESRLSDLKLDEADLRFADLTCATMNGTSLVAANLNRSILAGAQVYSAHFEETDLAESHMKGTRIELSYFRAAVMQGVSLEHALVASTWFSNARLNRANLTWGHFFHCRFDGVDLRLSDLQHTTLFRADLGGSDLRFANLKHARLVDCKFDTQTYLPDGTNWHDGVDIERFTNPLHPNFWQTKAKVIRTEPTEWGERMSGPATEDEWRERVEYADAGERSSRHLDRSD